MESILIDQFVIRNGIISFYEQFIYRSVIGTWQSPTCFSMKIFPDRQMFYFRSQKQKMFKSCFSSIKKTF